MDMGMFAVLPFILILAYIALFGLIIACMIFFIMLMRRAIEALDIHLDEKRNKK